MERWSNVERLFHSALERQPEARAAWLAEACGDDTALRREVESLLAQSDSAEAPSLNAANSSMTGQRVGAYEIQALLGVGGMGQVYRARDTTLGREVAIKVLPKAFRADPDRIARFEREARLLATLNHPNIATIHGLEKSADGLAIVMELVAGDTLAQRIARGRLALPDALAIARQVAEALDAAHMKGIVHRDLKPANIAVAAGGVVKVLDFGLAKIASGDEVLNQTAMPTIAGATREGLVVGTAAYMSPEQARGQAVDKRTDIWAFGCVLYEMLTGRAAFARQTIADTLAAVVEGQPDWSALPATVPEQVRVLLLRCCERDARLRLRDIGDALFQLQEGSASTLAPPATGARARERAAWAIAGLLVVAMGVSLAFTSKTTPAPPAASLSRTTITLPPGARLHSGSGVLPIAMSADGSKVAYVAEREGQTQFYVRELGELVPKAISGTEGARHPFFSPDGQWLAFFAGGALQKVAVSGGAPLRLCNVSNQSMGGSWGPDGTIVFATIGADLQRISVNGGAPLPLKNTAPAAWPDILPEGKTVLFTTGRDAKAGFAVTSLDGGPTRVVARRANVTLEGPAMLGTGGDLLQARYVATGHIVYGQSPGLVEAVPFDLASLTVKGSPVSMVDSVERAASGGGVYFGVSQTGLLIYAATGQRHQLVWVDRAGIVTPISEDRAAFRTPHLSPDGTQIAVAISDETRRSDIWLYDARRGTRRRVTSENHNLEPLWSRGGTHLTFSTREGIVEVPASGGNPNVLLEGRGVYPDSWSPDGQTLVYQDTAPHGSDLWSVSRAPGAKPRGVVVRPGDDKMAAFSVDGRWIAFASDEAGRPDVYVARFPDLSEKMTVSTEGGIRPHWSRDGRELFYRQGTALMAVPVTLGAKGSVGKPHRLFAGDFSGESDDPDFDVSSDSSRFVMVKSDEAAGLRQLTVVQNWFEELKRRVQASNR